MSATGALGSGRAFYSSAFGDYRRPGIRPRVEEAGPLALHSAEARPEPDMDLVLRLAQKVEQLEAQVVDGAAERQRELAEWHREQDEWRAERALLVQRIQVLEIETRALTDELIKCKTERIVTEIIVGETVERMVVEATDPEMVRLAEALAERMELLEEARKDLLLR